MVVDYKSRKNEVLASYDKVEDLVAALIENAIKIGMPNPVEQTDAKGNTAVWPLLTDIRGKAERVRADRFSLMIAGEAKSGKSTFINAYLGFELLPMDTLQCTSSIVEIKYGKEFFVRATYADGRKQEIRGDSYVQEFLKKNAALDDEYREIPVPTINNEILVKFGVKAKAKGLSIDIPQRDIENLVNAPEIQEANIHRLSVQDYNNKIRDYISKKKNNWHSIVIKIELFFPFSEDLKGIEIIDSPGVCARGGVEDFTYKYIENADAIIFLKPVTGQALESSAFSHFLGNESVRRNKNAIFLVLTHITSKSNADLRSLESEAQKIFKELDKKHILLVDSKAELYAKRFAPLSETERLAELQKLNADGKMEDFLKTAWNTDPFNPNKKEFIDDLHEKSQFAQINDALERFGNTAHYLLFGELLEAINRLYSKLYSNLGTQVDYFQQKAENPKELAKKIMKVQDELRNIESKIRNGVDNVWGRFRGNNGVIITTAEEAVKNFDSQVQQINGSSDLPFSELEQAAKKKAFELSDFKKNIRKDFVEECNKELIVLNDSEIPADSLELDIEAIFDDIREDYNKKKDETIPETTGWACFKETNNVPKYSKSQLFGTMKKGILTRLGNIKEDNVRELFAFVDTLRSSYLNELEKNFESKKQEFTAIVQQKATAEETQLLVKRLKELRDSIKESQSAVLKIKGGIDKYVQ